MEGRVSVELLDHLREYFARWKREGGTPVRLAMLSDLQNDFHVDEDTADQAIRAIEAETGWYIPN